MLKAHKPPILAGQHIPNINLVKFEPGSRACYFQVSCEAALLFGQIYDSSFIFSYTKMLF